MPFETAMKEEVNDQTIKCHIFLESQAQADFNVDNGDENQDIKEEEVKDNNEEDIRRITMTVTYLSSVTSSSQFELIQIQIINTNSEN